MRNKKLMFLAVVVMIFAWTSIAQARGHDRGYGDGPNIEGRGPGEEEIQKMHKGLDITEEQAVQLKANREQQKGRMKNLKERVKEKRQALKEVLEKEGVTEVSVEASATALKDVQASLVDEKIRSVLSVKSILTPEQYEKFNEKMGKRRPRKEKEEKKQGRRSDREDEGEDRGPHRDHW